MKGARSNLAVVPWVYFQTHSRTSSPAKRHRSIEPSASPKKSFARVREATRRPSSNVAYTYPSERTNDGSESSRAVAIARARANVFIPARTSWGDNVGSSRAQSRSSLAAANERTGALRDELLALDASSLLRKLARMNSYGRSINHELIRILLLSSRRKVTRRASIETASASNRRRRLESSSSSLQLISSFPSERRERRPGSMHLYETSITPNPSRGPPPLILVVVRFVPSCPDPSPCNPSCPPLISSSLRRPRSRVRRVHRAARRPPPSPSPPRFGSPHRVSSRCGSLSRRHHRSPWARGHRARSSWLTTRASFHRRRRARRRISPGGAWGPSFASL